MPPSSQYRSLSVCEHRKHNQPDDQQEVPVHGAQLDAESLCLWLCAGDHAENTLQPHIQTARDVKRVESREQEVEIRSWVARQINPRGLKLVPGL